jgi:small GTP-binding protein
MISNYYGIGLIWIHNGVGLHVKIISKLSNNLLAGNNQHNMTLRNEAKTVFARLKTEDESKVRIALFGQPGAGKSSLINAITGQQLAPEGVNTDTTTEAISYEWHSLLLVDLPGYGTKGFPRETYFSKFDILSFDAFICCFDGKLRDADVDFFTELKRRGKPCIFVRNKVDALFQRGSTIDELKKRITEEVQRTLGEKTPFIFTSCRTGTGISTLQDAVASGLGEVARERFFRFAKAYSTTFLESKRKSCEGYIALAAGTSAANGLNPTPGLDVSVDAGILIGLFAKIKAAYGIKDESLGAKDFLPQALAPIANRIISFASKDGLMILLKKYAGRVVAKSLVKWVPFVGQLIAASAGFAITMAAGKDYLKDCHAIAEYILNEEMKNEANK